MPIGGNAQVTINVGAKLQVLQSSVNEIQKVLDKLEPNSTAFKRLNTIISNIKTDMERLQVQSSKGFISQAQFNQTERTIDKIESSLGRTKIIIDNLNFKDIKLTPEQEQTFKDFEKELEDIEVKYTEAREKIKQGLLADDSVKDSIFKVDKKLINKDLDDIEKAVHARAGTIQADIYNTQKAIDDLTSKVNLGKKANSILDNGIGLQDYSKYIYDKGNGVLGFKPGEAKKQFYQALKEEFDLDDEQYAEIANLSFTKLQEAFKEMREGNRLNIFEGVTSGLKKNKDALATQEANLVNYENLSGALQNLLQRFAELNSAEGASTQAQDAYNAAVRQVVQAIEDARNAALGKIKVDNQQKDANDKARQSIAGLREELERTNVEFLKQQRQLQTFNSIKSAIVNFMGFNQVLNITRNAVRNAINHIKELDTTMNGIAIVTDMTTADLWKQVDAYSSMAQNFGVTIQGAYEVSKIYYQAGYETNEVLTLTNETLKLAKISGLDYATTTDYMMTA